MGKAAKGSRKGKKAWRANISTADIEDYLEKATREEHHAQGLSSLPDHSLFFSDAQSQSLNTTSTPKRRKTDLHRQKPLRHEAPLQRIPSFSIPSSKHRKPISSIPTTTSTAPAASATPPPSASDSHLSDLWQTQNQNQNHKHKHRPLPSPIPPVEIEPLGCSFNPPFHAHQDALAKAVADEMQKLYHKELQPDPVPLTVVGQPPISEEDKFFLDASPDDDNTDDDAHDSNPHHQLPPKPKPKKLTRVDLNRRARRKDLLRAQAHADRIQNLSKQIDSLPHIINEIEKEDQQKEKRHTRRLIAKQERLKTAPPRLGKPK